MRSGAASGSSPTEQGDAGRSQADAGRSHVGCGQSEGDGVGSQRAAISRPGDSKAAREESESANAREGLGPIELQALFMERCVTIKVGDRGALSAHLSLIVKELIDGCLQKGYIVH